MTPTRIGLGFLLVSLLVGVIVLSPVASLFAQETSPVPTHVPYEELPVCPPLILNPSNPTPAPDWDDIQNGFVCRGPYV